MFLTKYWGVVRSLSVGVGSLYVASKLVFGIGIGILISRWLEFSSVSGLIFIIIGVLMMLPAERVIFSELFRGKKKHSS